MNKKNNYAEKMQRFVDEITIFRGYLNISNIKNSNIIAKDLILAFESEIQTGLNFYKNKRKYLIQELDTLKYFALSKKQWEDLKPDEDLKDDVASIVYSIQQHKIKYVQDLLNNL